MVRVWVTELVALSPHGPMKLRGRLVLYGSRTYRSTIPYFRDFLTLRRQDGGPPRTKDTTRESTGTTLYGGKELPGR